MTGPITRHRDIESLKTATRWPGAEHAAALDLLAGRRPIAHPYIISAIRAATRLTASGSIGR